MSGMFDYELVCGHCGLDLGTFVQGDDFAETPHTCPDCHSRHMTQHEVPRSQEWARSEAARGETRSLKPASRVWFLRAP